jgi:hypothetical protein
MSDGRAGAATSPASEGDPVVVSTSSGIAVPLIEAPRFETT